MQLPGENDRGERVSGELHSTDASGGAEVTLYDADGNSRALAADERLAVDYLSIVTAAGGDAAAYFDIDDDNLIDAGEVLWRGDVAANGGAVLNWADNPRVGPAGAKPHARAPVGVLDVTLRGRILKPVSRSGPVGAPGHRIA